MTDLNVAYSRPEATAAKLEKYGADLARRRSLLAGLRRHSEYRTYQSQ
jgi:hypothetical protein